MSSPLRCLLWLPASLRAQALLHGRPYSKCSFLHGTIRAFSSNSIALKSLKPGRKAPVRPTVSQQPLPPQASPGLKKLPLRPPLPKPINTVPYLDTLLKHGDEILVFKAANHRSFRISCYIIGGLILIGGLNWAVILQGPGTNSATNEPVKPGYLLTAVTMGTVLVLGVFGTAILLAPVKMVRTVSVRSARATATESAGRPMLRCEMENDLPFMKTKVVDVHPSEAFLDRNVQAVEIDLTSIPLDKAADFTSTAPKAAAPPAATLNQSYLARTATTIFMDIRRMFYREGIAYLRVEGHGHLKLDLQHCELLDHGRPLDHLTTPDKARGVGPTAWAKRAMGSY